MRDIREPNWRALTACLLSEQSEQEAADVQRWLDESPDHVALLAMLRSALRDRPSSPEETARAWAAIQQRIRPSSPGTERRPSNIDGAYPRWRHAARWGAAACVAAVTVALFVHTRKAATPLARQAYAPVQEVITQPDQHAVVRLPDGSTVVLGVASRLRYATTFDRSERDVYLDGEAYFTVTHASGWPFVVHAGNVTARVLGTRFLVRKYASDTAARVVVAQGRVTVRHEILKAGDAIAAGPSGFSITHGVDMGRELTWTDGALQLRGTPLSAAIPTLERAFGITISVGDSTLLAEPITASLDNETAREALQIVAAITHSRAVWTRDHVLLSRP